MTDLLTICNVSLMRIGAKSQIQSLNEVSLEAVTFNTIFPQARDATLASHDWNFARRRVAGALSTITPPDNWSYAYAYPSDALRVLAVIPMGGAWPWPMRWLQHIRHEVAGYSDASGNESKVIYSNVQGAEIIYTRQVTDPTVYDPQFVSTLTWQCGLELAMPITGDNAKVQMCLSMFNSALLLARAQAANEGGNEHRMREAEWTRHRGLCINDWSMTINANGTVETTYASVGDGLLTEEGDVLLTESGAPIIIE